MKKQVKSFGEFTRRKVNEDHFFPEPYGEESDILIGDQVYVVGMGDFPGEVVGFDTDENGGDELIIVSMLGNEDLYTRDEVSTEPFQSNIIESVFDGTWRQREGYDQDEWFKKMKEYQEWLKELLGHYPYGPKLKIETEYKLSDKEKKLLTIVYFDSLSDYEEEEIVEKAKEINEYRKIGHDPGWKDDIYRYLRELENTMFGYRIGEFERQSVENGLDGYFKLTKANGGSPYQLKKGMLDSDRTPILGVRM